MPSIVNDRSRGTQSTLAIKAPVRVRTTAAIALSGLQIIDGVQLVEYDRVMVANQADNTENGLYVATTSSWQRAPDFDGQGDVVTGTQFKVVEGTVYAGNWYELTTANDVVFGTSAITFSNSGSAAALLPIQVAAEAAQAAAEAAQAAAELAETNAETAETNAETAETNTEALFNQFDVKYLGSKAADPALDNSGNPLIDGALYFNTTANVIKVYDLGTTTWLDTVAADNTYVLKAGDSFTGLVNLNDGADIASASTVDLTAATGNTVRITGTTAITAFTMNAGQQMELVAVGALPLTYHATTMNINGGANYTCAAGDRIKAVKDGAGVVRVNITKQDGTAVVSSSLAIVSAANNPSFNSTSDTDPATPAWIRGWVVARVFTSTNQSMTAGGLLTIAHGLGVVPKKVYLELVCTTADGVYALNDILEIAGVDEGSAQNAGTTVRKDSTNVYVRIGSSGILLLNNSGAAYNITLSNFRLVAKAEA